MSIKIKSSKAVMNTKWDCSNAAVSMNLAENYKCHMALLRPSHSILWIALNKEIDIGILQFNHYELLMFISGLWFLSLTQHLTKYLYILCPPF